MARDLVNSIAVPRGAWLDIEGQRTTVDATFVTNGGEILAGLSERVMILITQTDGTAHDIIIRSIYGTADDLVQEIALTTGEQIIMFETMKYEQIEGADVGKIFIDFETGFVGEILVLATPK